MVFYKEDKPRYFLRIFWLIINKTVFRLLVGTKMYRIKNFLLRAFGAKLARHCNIYSSVDVFAPWNLEVEENVTIGPGVNIYNRDKVIVKSFTTISQGSYICAGSHDISKRNIPLVTKPIIIESYCWVAANCFIGPGVIVREGCVLSATSSLFSSTVPWGVYRGNPAVRIKERNLDND